MAKAGRPSKPADVKKLEGNPGNRPVKEPVRPAGKPRKPRHLTGYAAEIWHDVLGAMPPAVYAATDAGTLAAYCLACDQLREATEHLLVEGIVIRPVLRVNEDGTWIYGAPKRNPWHGVSVSAMEKIASLGGKLGLDPIARENLGAKPAEPPKSKFGGLVGIAGGRQAS
jgi:P27 family predicted phage terminase small subunit